MASMYILCVYILSESEQIKNLTGVFAAVDFYGRGINRNFVVQVQD